jgi:hypothetical protein
MRIRCDHEVLDTDAVTTCVYPSINAAKRDNRGAIDQACDHKQFQAHRMNLLRKHKHITGLTARGAGTRTDLSWGLAKHMKRVLTPHTPHIPKPKKPLKAPPIKPTVTWLARKVPISKIDAALVNRIAHPL